MSIIYSILGNHSITQGSYIPCHRSIEPMLLRKVVSNTTKVIVTLRKGGDVFVQFLFLNVTSYISKKQHVYNKRRHEWTELIGEGWLLKRYRASSKWLALFKNRSVFYFLLSLFMLLPYVKLTARPPWKLMMGRWFISFLGWPIFRGLLSMFGRVVVVWEMFTFLTACLKCSLTPWMAGKRSQQKSFECRQVRSLLISMISRWIWLLFSSSSS